MVYMGQRECSPVVQPGKSGRSDPWGGTLMVDLWQNRLPSASMIALFCLLLALSASAFKSKSRLAAENAALRRRQLAVLRRKVRGRIRFTNCDRCSSFSLSNRLYRPRPGGRPDCCDAARNRPAVHRQGLTVSAIARQIGMDRKTIRRYIARGLEPPAYGPRPPRAEEHRSVSAVSARAERPAAS